MDKELIKLIDKVNAYGSLECKLDMYLMNNDCVTEQKFKMLIKELGNVSYKEALILYDKVYSTEFRKKAGFIYSYNFSDTPTIKLIKRIEALEKIVSMLDIDTLAGIVAQKLNE